MLEYDTSRIVFFKTMISIAMATYNGGRFIREQLDSILNQTLSDFELIITDDNSTDDTLQILREYELKDCRIQVFVNEERLGYLGNFSKAMTCCTGDFIALCDQDDLWMPTHLEILYRGIGDKSMICGNSELIDAEGNLIGMSVSERESLDSVPNDSLKVAMRILYNHNTFFGHNMLFRRSLLEIILPFPKGVSYHDTWTSTLSCFMGGFVYTDEIITYYRMHSDNLSLDIRTRKSNLIRWMRVALKGLYGDRVPMIEAIIDRVPDLNECEIQFLIKSKNRFINRLGFWNQLLNLIYVTRNYKTIFS